MPQHKSCKKRIKTSQKEKLRNRAIKGNMKGALKAMDSAKTLDEANSLLPRAISILDQATQRSVIHRNAAARQKSRLYALVASLKG